MSYQLLEMQNTKLIIFLKKKSAFALYYLSEFLTFKLKNMDKLI